MSFKQATAAKVPPAWNLALQERLRSVYPRTPHGRAQFAWCAALDWLLTLSQHEFKLAVDRMKDACDAAPATFPTRHIPDSEVLDAAAAQLAQSSPESGPARRPKKLRAAR